MGDPLRAASFEASIASIDKKPGFSTHPLDQDLRGAGRKVGPSGAGNQVHLQRLDALKAGITRDHHGIRPQLQAASGLQCIVSAQPMVGAQLRRQLHHRGAELHNQQIRLGKQRLKTIQAG